MGSPICRRHNLQGFEREVICEASKQSRPDRSPRLAESRRAFQNDSARFFEPYILIDTFVAVGRFKRLQVDPHCFELYNLFGRKVNPLVQMHMWDDWDDAISETDLRRFGCIAALCSGDLGIICTKTSTENSSVGIGWTLLSMSEWEEMDPQEGRIKLY
jgi:hypothetical protein